MTRSITVILLALLFALPVGNTLAGGGPPPTVAWSPDGTQIVYSAYPEQGGMDIFISDADGQNARNLSNSDDCDYYPVWSPDGTQVAYSSGINCTLETAICVADAFIDSAARCTPLEQITWPRPFWSPNGAYIGYGGKGVLDATTGELRWLAGEYVTASLRGFSADGQMIAYETGNGVNREIWLQNIDGSENRSVTNNEVDDTFLRWSPQGSRFAYSSGQEALETVTLLDADDLTTPIVTLENVWLFAWSPDGSQIGYSARSTADDPSHIWVANADGSNVRQIVEAYFLEWSLDGERLSTLGEDAALHIDLLSGETVNAGWDIASHRTVWSPDWSRVTFETLDSLCIGAMADRSLRCMDVDVATVPAPAWSPDGERLAYMEDGAQQLTVVTVDEVEALPNVMP